MALDLPLVRGRVDPCVGLRDSLAPDRILSGAPLPGGFGAATAIGVAPSGHVMVDGAEGGSGRVRLARMAPGRASALVRGGARASFIGAVGGRAVVAVEVENGGDGAGGRWRHLRSVGHLMGGDDAALALSGVALAAWHRDYRYCGRCAGALEPECGGWAARCGSCGRLEYPRQDPAVIVRVDDHRGRTLLAHNAAWEPGRVSVIAGFVEAGESPDRAVAREVGEEVAIGIGEPRYVGTQPWPFPRSQMMGYVARTLEESPAPAPDGAEIEWAGFYSRQELADAVGSGRLLAPGRSSIAYAMLRQWYGGELPLPGRA